MRERPGAVPSPLSSRLNMVLLAVFVSAVVALPCWLSGDAERSGSKSAAPRAFALPARAALGPGTLLGSAFRGAAAPRGPSAPSAPGRGAAALPGLAASAFLSLALSCFGRCRGGRRLAPRAASVVRLAAEAKGAEAAMVAEEEEEAEEDDLDFDEDEEDEFDDYEGDEGDRLEARCKAMYLNGSPMKFRRVLWQIRGRSYREALMLLEFLPWRACKPVLCCLQSAAANAQNHFNMDKSRLYISRCKAEKGPRMKRMRPVSKGQAHMYVKRTAHLTIWVAEMEDDQLDELS